MSTELMGHAERIHDQSEIHSGSRLPEGGDYRLAYALLYEGVRIRVFYDRGAAAHPQGTHAVLVHVMAHEITHILQQVMQNNAAHHVPAAAVPPGLL